MLTVRVQAASASSRPMLRRSDPRHRSKEQEISAADARGCMQFPASATTRAKRGIPPTAFLTRYKSRRVRRSGHYECRKRLESDRPLSVVDAATPDIPLPAKTERRPIRRRKL